MSAVKGEVAIRLQDTPGPNGAADTPVLTARRIVQ
jgi:hypothetical protein